VGFRSRGCVPGVHRWVEQDGRGGRVGHRHAAGYGDQGGQAPRYPHARHQRHRIVCQHAGDGQSRLGGEHGAGGRGGQALRHHQEPADQPQEHGAPVCAAGRRRHEPHASADDRQGKRNAGVLPRHGPVPAHGHHQVRGHRGRGRPGDSGHREDGVGGRPDHRRAGQGQPRHRQIQRRSQGRGRRVLRVCEDAAFLQTRRGGALRRGHLRRVQALRLRVRGQGRPGSAGAHERDGAGLEEQRRRHLLWERRPYILRHVGGGFRPHRPDLEGVDGRPHRGVVGRQDGNHRDRLRVDGILQDAHGRHAHTARGDEHNRQAGGLHLRVLAD